MLVWGSVGFGVLDVGFRVPGLGLGFSLGVGGRFPTGSASQKSVLGEKAQRILAHGCPKP